MASPVSNRSDPRFSILVAEGILRNHTPDLSGFRIAGLQAAALPSHPDLSQDLRPFYQLVKLNGKVLCRYPFGSSLLSIPFVAFMDMLGISAARPDGSYDPIGELCVERLLAALLMAVLACVFLRTSALLLPMEWSMVLAVGGAFGTQIWSTATRALWSYTWEAFLAGWVVFLLLRAEEKRERLEPVLLATLLSWMFIVRPSGAIPVAGVTLYMIATGRPGFLYYAVTGALWLVAFLAYSWLTLGQLIPDYYRQGVRFGASGFAHAFAANLISPSRGLLVFVPQASLALFLVAGYWKTLPNRRLAVLSLAIVGMDLVLVSAYPTWWGGWSYGPRMLTSVVPWFVLLAALGCKAMLADCSASGTRLPRLTYKTLVVAGGLALTTLGVAINGRGAISWQTALWNERVQIDCHPERAWDWRSPQFLAGLVEEPPPHGTCD